MLSEKRYGLITGSACSVLFPKKSAEVGQTTYAKLLAKEYVFKHRDEITTWQMEHGHMGEIIALEWFQENIDKSAHIPEFKNEGVYGGSADCLCDGYGVDFKCPASLEKWLEYLTDGISDQQYHQVQMYMHLYNRDKWKICAFLTETSRMVENGYQYPIDDKKRCIVINVEKDDGWFTQLEEKSKFVIEKRDFYIKIYQELI